MKSNGIYYFGTSEQLINLEKMVDALPESTILDWGEKTRHSHLKAHMLCSNTIELSPLTNNQSLEVKSPSPTTSTDTYVDFSWNGFNYRIRYNEEKN